MSEIGGNNITASIGGTNQVAGYLGGTIRVFGPSAPVVTTIAWTEAYWKANGGGSPTSLNQQGTTISGQTNGPAVSVALQSSETPNTGATKQESITYRVTAPADTTTTVYTPDFFDDTVTVTQAGVEYTTSGTITDSVTNATVDRTSYSITGEPGETETFTINVTPASGYQFTGAASVSVLGSTSGVAIMSQVVVGTSIRIVMIVTAQSNNRTVDLDLSGAANIIPSVPTVTTSNATQVGTTEMYIQGEITDTGDATITDRFILFDTFSPPTTKYDEDDGVTGNLLFADLFQGLTAGTTYYFRAGATNSAGTGYGTIKSQATLALQPPSIATLTAGTITTDTARLTAQVTDTGGSAITEVAFYYRTGTGHSLTSLPATGWTKAVWDESLGTSGLPIQQVSGLSMNTTYSVVATATNNDGTAFGGTNIFTTLAEAAPTVTTNTADVITTNSARLNGTVTAGTADVTETLFRISTSSATIDADGGSVVSPSPLDVSGNFSANATGLDDNTTYYFKAFATSNHGTGEGIRRSFTTNEQTYSGSIVFSVANNVQTPANQSYSNKVGGATIAYSGFTLSAVSGYQFSGGSTTVSIPAGTTTVPSSGGNASVNLSSYTVTPIPDPGFGADDLNVTSSGVIPAVGVSNGANVTLFLNFDYETYVDDITATAAIAQNDTTSSKTVNLQYSIEGTTPPGFLNNGQPFTIAGSIQMTQSAGTTPTVSTSAATGVGQTSATLNGSVIGGTGGATDTWFRYSATQSTVDGGGGTRVDVVPTDNAGSFSQLVSGLMGGTTYYYRAYGSNAVGTSNGTTQMFTTEMVITANPPTVVTDAATTGAFGIEFDGSITTDGGATITEAGFIFSTVSTSAATLQLPTGGNIFGVTALSVGGAPQSGPFSSASGPVADGTWAYRAYATNSEGTGYGTVRSISYSSGGGLPGGGGGFPP